MPHRAPLLITICFVFGLASWGLARAATQPRVYIPLIRADGGPTITPTQPVPATPTVTRTPTITPVPVTLLPNGDFEQGAALWEPQVAATTVITTNAPIPAHSGTYVARLVASEFGMGMEIDLANQVVPAVTPYLSYWVWIQSTEPVCGSDRGGVAINPTAIDKFNLCVATQTDQWVRRSLDLSAYAGDTVTIILIVDTFDTDSPNSTLFIDDIGWRAAP